MYEAFYGLREKPFNLTPDPRFLFLSEKHKEAFAHLLYGIKNRGGFVMVTGEIGTGKTTICRTLLNNLEDDTEVAFVFNPCLSPEELLRTINQDFGISSRATTIKGLIDELNAYLLDRRARNKNCVLVIDEAQNLAPAVLEQIRLLSNLETETEKLLQIVLIGQPELAEHLQLTELRQLNQRITARYHLRELGSDETLQYIAYRLRVAGGRKKVRFTRRAVKAIYRASGGVPRVINAICDRALLIGYTVESREITASTIRRAAREVRGERLRPVGRRSWLRTVAKPVGVAAALGVALAATYWMVPLGNWFRQDMAVARTTHQESAPLKTPEPAPTPATPAATPATDNAAVDYEAMLDELDPVVARNAGAEAILRKWGVAEARKLPRGETAPDLVQFAADNGLDAEPLLPTLEQLIGIDLPAFALIQGRDGMPMWIGLVGRDGENLQVALGPDRVELIPRDIIYKRYTVQAVVLWRDPAPGAVVLSEAAQGDTVLALQNQLKQMGRLSTEPTGIFDAATAAAIRRLQSELSLGVDGKVGRQTRMALSRIMPETGTARLSTPMAPPAPVAIEAAATEAAPAPSGTMPVAVAATTTAPPAPYDGSGVQELAGIPGPENRETAMIANTNSAGQPGGRPE
ncbi:MAG: AAA family ATPase [FCB group bacterium]|jgi:general secretion pathway protein A|nr:AAA family ATPase [FCB group bacterium]